MGVRQSLSHLPDNFIESINMADKKKPQPGKLVGRDAPPASRKPNNLTKKSKADKPSALWKFAKSITEPAPGAEARRLEKKREFDASTRSKGDKGRR